MKWFWVVFLVLIPSVLGATIHGTVYDFGLNKLTNAVVEINTTPHQQMVAANGTYSFVVPQGTYTLEARHQKSDSEIEENITVKSEGDYVLDLILLPSLDQDEELLDTPDVPLVEDIVQDKPVTQWLLWIVVFAVLAYLVYKVSRRPTKVTEKVKEVIREIREVAVPDDLQKIMKFIENEGGRTTQKDIRKQFPYSEAKISLMIDELEAKGLVKKVKKGRGNLILKA
jgi:uncharacterized membrane protein